MHNFSLYYPYVIKQTGNENTQTHQVGVIFLDQTPNFHNQFPRKCIAVKGEKYQ